MIKMKFQPKNSMKTKEVLLQSFSLAFLSQRSFNAPFFQSFPEFFRSVYCSSRYAIILPPTTQVFQYLDLFEQLNNI